jgi:hypothetical protein
VCNFYVSFAQFTPNIQSAHATNLGSLRQPFDLTNKSSLPKSQNNNPQNQFQLLADKKTLDLKKGSGKKCMIT